MSTSASSSSSSASSPSTPPPIDHHAALRASYEYELPSSSYIEDELDEDLSAGFDEVKRDPTSWAGGLPEKQGLYDPENEKDVSSSVCSHNDVLCSSCTPKRGQARRRGELLGSDSLSRLG